MVTMKLLMLLSLLTTVFGDLRLFRGIGPLHSEKIYRHCFFWAERTDPGIMVLHQHWEQPTPSEIITLQLEKASSKVFQSVFELRTFDPEGVIFYGDADGIKNWFVLALRNGRPEIQISNEYGQLVISAGTLISDGTWKKFMVRSQKNAITLIVNEETVLVIAILPSVGLDDSLIDMRIGIGGLLINESSLLIPLRHPLDACIRNWDWLEQNTSWLVEKVSRNPNRQCPTNIVPGSFFPGVGMAAFRSR
ncbi:sex hormone-binding globulin-like, partial [Chiloscyllium punctatum]|uniref:sex hormone-binding globulin-like n=1 Tax=Chiloscyllium punctatum TaxID=137246 RepID=UPI003B63B39C